MGMFNDFIDNAKAVAQKVGEKTSDAYDITKLSAVKCRISNDINKNLKALGKQYYTLYKDNKLDTAVFSKQIAVLDDLYAQYDTIVKQIDDIKNLKRCPVCGKAQDTDKPFCADCGAKL